MGLGKTVQTIALILANRSEDRKKKSNLILAYVARPSFAVPSLLGDN